MSERKWEVGQRVAMWHGYHCKRPQIVSITKVHKLRFYTDDGRAWRADNGRLSGNNDKWTTWRVEPFTPEQEAAWRNQAEIEDMVLCLEYAKWGKQPEAVVRAAYAALSAPEVQR